MIWFFIAAILLTQGFTLIVAHFILRTLRDDLYSEPEVPGRYAGACGTNNLADLKRHKEILAKIGVVMSLADQIEAAVAKLNEAVADNNINVGALKNNLTSLSAQVTTLQKQVADLTAAGSAPDPELVQAVDDLVVAADAVKAQADALEPVAPVEVPAVAVEADTPAAQVADGGLIEASIIPEVPSVPVEQAPDAPVADVPAEVVTPVPVDPEAAPVAAGDLHPATTVVEVPNTTPVEVPEGATPIAAGELPPDAVVTPVETGDGTSTS